MKRCLHCLSYLVFSGLLLACSRAEHVELPTSATILAFGDSLTAGVGTTADNAYPNVLAQLSQRTVVNAGIAGETTQQGRQRFTEVLAQHSPQLIILLEGGNDILRNQPLSETKKNLSAMITAAQAQKIPVLLLGVPEKNLFSTSADIYSELADQHDVLFMEDLVSDLLRTSRYKSDTVHLNSDGYREMAETIFEFLQDEGLL